MATEIKLPALGENVDSGTVVKILVSPGDKVTEDQPVLDLETEKASVEVPASASGTVKEIRVKEGDTIKVGQVLLTLQEGTDAERKRDSVQPQPAKGAETKPKTEDKKTPPTESATKPEAEKEVEETAEAHAVIELQEVRTAPDHDDGAEVPARDLRPQRHLQEGNCRARSVDQHGRDVAHGTTLIELSAAAFLRQPRTQMAQEELRVERGTVEALPQPGDEACKGAIRHGDAERDRAVGGSGKGLLDRLVDGGDGPE